ncbi:unnamed protein product [Penicillium salamii]|nr:unnamed protein product [Penicillium salamii]CAG8028523.1 unnamed protein product [Penicillium salamii]CAG8410484.1 unnamed protein product [Penicillium salamii]
MDKIQDVVNSHEFVTAILPLYRDTQVKIRVVPSNKEYTISKAMICAESPVFSAMFEGNFQESHTLTTELEEMKDIVSVRSVEALIMWLYLRTVRFDITDNTECISAALELARLADMYKIVKVETKVAQYIKGKLLKSPVSDWGRVFDHNTRWINSEHITSVNALPFGHPARKVLASATVRGILSDSLDEVSKAIEANPLFGADIFQELRPALTQMRDSNDKRFVDPLTGELSYFR